MKIFSYVLVSFKTTSKNLIFSQNYLIWIPLFSCISQDNYCPTSTCDLAGFLIELIAKGKREVIISAFESIIARHIHQADGIADIEYVLAS